jgi:SAM-dependent methyltransferase
MLRDTNADWAGIAGEPFYGVFSHPEWFREHITEDRLQEFWRTGEVEIDGVLGKLRHHFGEFSPRTAIDFGCGVGRLSRGMARHAGHVYGVDVAEGMINEARKHAPANVTYGFEIPDQQVDWINSIIVFQHIHPANGFPLLQTLIDRLAPGGGLTLQFGTYKDRRGMPIATDSMDAVFWDGETLRALRETPYGSGAMLMYDYDLNRVTAMLNAAGVNDIMLSHTDHGGNHGAFVLGRKAA